jgi:HEAT repeat protein
MPTTILCPNAACAKSLRVPDAPAGKAGKCPACGTRIVFTAPKPDEPASRQPVTPAAAPAQPPGSGTSNKKLNITAVTSGVIRFEAVGEAWRLFKQQAGVWIAAALIVGFCSAGLQLLLNLLSIPISLVGGAILPGISFFTSLASVAVAWAISGVFLGGMYGMALKQVDGNSIGVRDLFPGADVLPSLALASVLATLAILVGLLCMVIPGLIIWALLLFTLPLIVDRRIKAIDAIGMSWTTLKTHWLQATVFVLVMWAVKVGGMLLCLVGSLLAFPVCVLAQAVLYRGFFPHGATHAKPVQALDPDFEPVGVEVGARPKGRIPVWAWLVALAGLLAPVVASAAAIAIVVAVFVSAARGLHQNDRGLRAFQEAVRDMEKRGQGAGPAVVAGPPGMPAPEEKLGGDLEAAQNKFDEMRKVIEAQNQAQAEIAREVAKAAPPDRRQATPRRADNLRKGTNAGAGTANPNDVTALIGDLTSDDEDVRKSALDRLARSAPDPTLHDEVTRSIGPLLVDPRTALRESAVRALAVWANANDVPALIVALDDEDPRIRRAAIKPLGRIKDERVVEPVARRLADPDAFVHNDAMRVLRQIGPIAEAEVVKCLNSPDVPTRERACHVLQTIGTQNSIRALTQVATGRSPGARAAQAALMAITTRQKITTRQRRK